MCLAAHDSEFRRWTGGVHLLKCQTFTASPAEPGELLFWFSTASVISDGCRASKIASTTSGASKVSRSAANIGLIDFLGGGDLGVGRLDLRFTRPKSMAVYGPRRKNGGAMQTEADKEVSLFVRIRLPAVWFQRESDAGSRS